MELHTQSHRTKWRKERRKKAPINNFLFQIKALRLWCFVYSINAMALALWLSHYRGKRVKHEERMNEKKTFNGNVITAFNINTIELNCIFVTTQKSFVIRIKRFLHYFRSHLTFGWWIHTINTIYAWIVCMCVCCVLAWFYFSLSTHYPVYMLVHSLFSHFLSASYALPASNSSFNWFYVIQ